MLGQNRDFREHIKDAGFDFRYEEHPGNHNWMYWAEHIAVGLDFILGVKNLLKSRALFGRIL